MTLLMEKPEGRKSTPLPVSVQEAQSLLLRGNAPENLHVAGALSLADWKTLTRLPKGLTVNSLDLTGCTNLEALPEGLKVRRLNLTGCVGLRSLPSGLECNELVLKDTVISRLPDNLKVSFRLDLSSNPAIESLPVGLKVGSLNLSNCTGLKSLPEGLDVSFLDISGCTALQGWPKQASVCVGRLNMHGCFQFTALPDWLTYLAQLDISGCPEIRELPERLRIGSWLELADSGIRSLPASLQQVRLRWRGVPVESRVVFQPETITASEVLTTNNVELRRVLLERMGLDAFMQQARSETLDRDTDAGGERKLLRVPMIVDEPLVCLAVFCPSTRRQYLLRVPPAMKTCRQAAAWLAGFDNEEDYRPLQET